jgi:spoIIIJ-associated protein
MPPAERRIVHLTLADSPDVVTVSIGEGDGRKVAITPRR